MLHSGAKIPPTVRLAFAAFLLASTAGEATARLVASSASDLCPDDADPCVVSTQVIVPENTTLDFGTRTLEIAETGSLRLVREGIVIRAGRIVVAPRDGVAIRQVTRGSKSVDVKLYAMRTCSAGSARCLDDDDCQLSGCNTHFCEGNPEQACRPGYDSYFCKPKCAPSGFCLPTNRACSNNADCDFGSCGATTFCDNTTRDNMWRSCTSYEDCAQGECSVGEGSVEINGEVRAAAREYGGLLVDAAGSITLNAPVTMVLPTPASLSDLYLESYEDSVFVHGRILHQSDYADTSLYSGLDVVLDGEIVMPGGSANEGVSGELYIDAGRDALMRGDIDVSSRRGGLEGGSLSVFAYGRVILDGGDAGDPMWLKANGARGSQLYEGGGYGGDIDLIGGQEVIVGPSVRIEARGGAPRSGGGGVTAGNARTRRLTFAGQVDVTGDDSHLHLNGDDIEVTASARISVDSTPEREGGTIQMRGCNVRIAGQVSLGEGLDIPLPNRFPHLDIRTGDLTLSATARITGAQTESPFLFQTSRAMLAEAGSVIDNPSGTNNIVYRNLAQPPVLSGLFTPAPNLTLDPTLVPCTP